MPTYWFTLAFEGVDPWDDQLIERLVEEAPGVHWGEVDGEVRAAAFAEAASGIEAVIETVSSTRRVCRQAKPVRMVEDFVAVSDIAERTGMNRETVRLWSLGARGPGGFPRPRGSVSNGVRIWDWATVNNWLRRHYGLGDEEQHLSASQVARLNDLFAAGMIPAHVETRRHRMKVVRAEHRWGESKPVTGFGCVSTEAAAA